MPIAQFNRFDGGLNLRDKADVVQESEAIDLLNVQFLERGAIKQRDGYSDLTASLTNRVDSMAPFALANGTRQILAGCGTRLEAINTSGGVVASATGLAGGPYTFARISVPGSEHAYAANGSDTFRRWDGSAWSAPTATVNGVAASAFPKAGAVTTTAAAPGNTSVTNAANRLVATAYGTATTSGPGGTASNPSRIHFSNVGDPTTWETDGASGRSANFIDVTPGDGEQIMGACLWAELLFVFKETKYFVFYGETRASGVTEFQYREVNVGVGLAAKQAFCVAREGVYFMSRRGMYLTNGQGSPTLLSDKIDPIWRGNPEVYFQSLPMDQTQFSLVRMAWHDEQVYLAYPQEGSTANDRVLVYDTQHKWWSLYDLPASALCSFRRGDQPELHFGYSSGNNRIGSIREGLTQDNGSTITSRWRSGWFDYNSSVIKSIRDTRIWGTDSVVGSYSRDFSVGFEQQQNFVFGSSTLTWPNGGSDMWPGGDATDFWPGGGQVNDALSRRVVRGVVFSTQFSNATGSQTWSVHRVARHLSQMGDASIVRGT